VGRVEAVWALVLVLVLVLVRQLWLGARRTRSYAFLDILFGRCVGFGLRGVVCRSSCSTGGRGQWTVTVAVVVRSEGRQQLGPLGRGQRMVGIA
jgi:hypothetical protein